MSSIVSPNIRIRHPDKVTISDGCILDDFTYISGRLSVGPHTHISSNCCLISSQAGEISIGAFVGISAGCCIYSASSEYVGVSMDLPSAPQELQFGGIVEPVVIGDYCLLGARTVVMPGVRLPEGVATAAGTILRKKHYEPWTLYNSERALCKRQQPSRMNSVSSFLRNLCTVR